MGLLRQVSLYAFFLFAALYSLTAIQMDNFADDPGVGWHLETGRWILDHQAVPRVDPFLQGPITAITKAGLPNVRPWVADQWLSDLLLAYLYDVGAYPLLYAFFVVLSLLTFFGVLYGQLRFQSQAGFAALCAMLLAAKIAQLHFILRPVQFSFFFFAVLLGMLWKLDKGIPLERKKRFYFLASLFALFCIWANMHPGFVLGFVLLATFLFAQALEPVLGWNQKKERKGFLAHLPFFAAIALVALLASLVNPYGADLHRSILGLAKSDFFMRYHDEWQPPRMGEFVGGLLQVLFGSLLLLPILCKKIPSAWTLFQVLSIFVFGRFALEAIRMAPFFAMAVSLPLIFAWRQAFELLSRLGGSFARLGELFQRLGKWEFLPRRGLLLLPLLCLGIIFGALPFWEVPQVGFRKSGFGPSPERFPYGALEFLLKNEGKAVVYNPSSWGGFLTRMGEGRIRAIIDDRNELLGEDWYRRYEKALLDEDTFQVLAQETGARYVLWSKKSGSFPVLESRKSLRKVFEDSVSALWIIDELKVLHEN